MRLLPCLAVQGSMLAEDTAAGLIFRLTLKYVGMLMMCKCQVQATLSMVSLAVAGQTPYMSLRHLTGLAYIYIYIYI